MRVRASGSYRRHVANHAPNKSFRRKLAGSFAGGTIANFFRFGPWPRHGICWMKPSYLMAAIPKCSLSYEWPRNLDNRPGVRRWFQRYAIGQFELLFRKALQFVSAAIRLTAQDHLAAYIEDADLDEAIVDVESDVARHQVVSRER